MMWTTVWPMYYRDIFISPYLNMVVYAYNNDSCSTCWHRSNIPSLLLNWRLPKQTYHLQHIQTRVTYANDPPNKTSCLFGSVAILDIWYQRCFAINVRFCVSCYYKSQMNRLQNGKHSILPNCNGTRSWPCHGRYPIFDAYYSRGIIIRFLFVCMHFSYFFEAQLVDIDNHITMRIKLALSIAIILNTMD